MCLMHGTLCCLGPNTNLRQNSEHTPQLPLTHLLPPAATCEGANTGTNTGTKIQEQIQIQIQTKYR